MCVIISIFPKGETEPQSNQNFILNHLISESSFHYYWQSHSGCPMRTQEQKEKESRSQIRKQISDEYSNNSVLMFPYSKKNQFSSVTQSCPTLCDHMDCSMPGLPVHHQLLEFTQTRVHWVSDAIQPSQPLLSPSLPTFNLSQHQGLFKSVSSSHQVAKILEFQLQYQSFQWILSTGFL